MIDISTRQFKEHLKTLQLDLCYTCILSTFVKPTSRQEQDDILYRNLMGLLLPNKTGATTLVLVCLGSECREVFFSLSRLPLSSIGIDW